MRYYKILHRLTLLTFFLSIISGVFAQEWQSKLVYYDNDDELIYKSDSLGNRIPDFSFAGYKNSEEPIPSVPTLVTLEPVEGDNTTHIENALFQLALMPLDSNGLRGALLLSAGVYEVSGTINISYDGVVLRGVGDGEDPLSNTIIKSTNKNFQGPPVIVAGGGARTEWEDEVSGSRRNIITDTLMVGEKRFQVSDASPFVVGDNIIIYHPCSAAWLEAIDYGGTFSDSSGAEPGVDVPWSVGSLPIVYNRNIKDISGDMITVDVPVYNHLIRDLSQSYIYKYSRQGMRTQIGIENLRIDIDAVDAYDENHAWNAIELTLIEDAWVRGCTMLHFGLSGVMTGTATRITIEDCRAIDPSALIEGGKRYNFNVYTASQQILFRDCHAKDGRHHYVSNGKSLTSGCVFVDCASSGAFTSSEGHRRWSQGLLFDNLIELDGPRPGFNPRLLGLYNRGYYGTSHGWAAAHSVAWACDMSDGDLIVQQPPTAQNYAIGCFGNITGEVPPSPFPVPEGYIEGSNKSGLRPRSLYWAQLEERIGPVSSIDVNGNGFVPPKSFSLDQNYPNPFNPGTFINYRLYRRMEVNISVFNLLGERVVDLVDELKSAGKYQIYWNGTDQRGKLLSTGVYILHMNTSEGLMSRSIVLLK